MEDIQPKKRHFSFPFEPYSIQHDFMTSLYDTLAESKLGIMESPTGTGKTMSLLCGSLQWLRDYHVNEKQRLENEAKDADVELDDGSCGGDWFNAQTVNLQKRRKGETAQRQLERLLEREGRSSALNNQRIALKNEVAELKKKYFVNAVHETPKLDEQNLFSLDEEDILTEESFESKILKDQPKPPVKIIFVSRTHSQLQQVLDELKKSPFGGEIRSVILASRQQYCVNRNVAKQVESQLINERCLELRQKSSKKSKESHKKVKTSNNAGCPYLQYPSSLELLKAEILLQNLDLESVVKIGTEAKACPYYASRGAIEDAEIVLMPYQLLLDAGTRQASGLDITNSVIIIDEAHNLLETISNIHSTQISGRQLSLACNQLNNYRDKFKDRFNAGNLLKLDQLLYVIKQLIKAAGHSSLATPLQKQSKKSYMRTLPEFLSGAEIDNQDLNGLVEFAQKSKLVHKIRSYEVGSQSQQKDAKKTQQALRRDESQYAIQAIMPVLAFIKKLTLDMQDGRILISVTNDVMQCKLKFLLLNPASQFKDVVALARSVIVAGGTMQPYFEFKEQLYISAGASPDRIVTFTCDHVVSPENILPLVVTHGPGKVNLNFTYEFRTTQEIFAETGRIVVNLANVVPGGVIVFFSSYEYLNSVYDHWKASGTLEKLARRKKVFREPQVASETEATLTAYSQAIMCPGPGMNGAVLLSVVGGKMSEGINFSDDLGRCVVVFGMPFPSKNPELDEKITFYNKHFSDGGTIQAGEQMYKNLCYKAINQCIGRAVRHKNDYAVMLLVDHRYERESSRQALPAWVRSQLQVPSSFGAVIGSIARFFNNKKKDKFANAA